jgi:hypothetical protein
MNSETFETVKQLGRELDELTWFKENLNKGDLNIKNSSSYSSLTISETLKPTLIKLLEKYIDDRTIEINSTIEKL